MEYVNDINIMEAVIHVLDSNSNEPILNEYKLELNEEVYKFLYKHLERAFKDDELKYAVFNPGVSTIKKVTQEFLNGETRDIVKVSQELANRLFLIMKGNAFIPSCHVVTVVISTDQGPMLAILKMDYAKSYTHKIDFIDNKVGVGIVENKSCLPTTAANIKKCAFIKPIRDNQPVNLMI